MTRIGLVTPTGVVEVDTVAELANLASHGVGMQWGVSQISSGLRVATFPHRRHAWDFMVAVAAVVPAIEERRTLSAGDKAEVRRLVELHSGVMPEEEE